MNDQPPEAQQPEQTLATAQPNYEDRPVAVSAPPQAPAGADNAAALALDLTAAERLRDGHVWLRYAVRGISGSGSA